MELEIARINELAKKKKEVGLTPEEIIEQAELRKNYLSAIRGNFKQTLDNISIKESDGTIQPLKKKC
ncbi:MAG: hypothetical protein K0R15_499 [Clostridiales bacterium]|jgi:uncharacterized protein YnzC (UPF0291/DUF896 family)|nr:hypothetical protein [Clostridiales bacterium]